MHKAVARFLLLVGCLSAGSSGALEALSARSFYMDEPAAALLLQDLAVEFADVDLSADVSVAGQILTRDAPIHRGRHVWIEFATAALPLGATEVVVQLRAGRQDLGRATAIVTRLPLQANAAQIDRLGGGLIVDGLPFFPFGFYCYSPVQPTLAEEEVVRGFNLMSPYQSNDPTTVSERRQYMDRAAELGMKVHYQLLRVAGGGGVSLGAVADTSASRRRAWLRAEIETFRDHPALLAWYISDEPTGHGATPEQLQTAADLVRELDPYHPVTIVFVNPGAAARFSHAMDLAMTDPYPIPNGLPGSIASAVRTVRDAVAPKIPLWLVPQAFGGNEWWSREPTAAELRLMTWLGIIEGATGVQYFIRHGLNGFPKSPDTWAAAGRAALEVAALTPYLLSPEAQPVVVTDDETLHAAAWRRGDDVVVAVTNTLNQPREMRLTLPYLLWDRDEVEVLYEDRMIPVRQLTHPGALGRLLKPVSMFTDLLRPDDVDLSGVRFTDIIDAYGVRLYRFAGPSQDTPNELNTLVDPGFEWDAAPSVPAALYADVGSGRGASYFVDSRIAAHGRRSVRLHSPRDDEGVRLRPYSPAVVPGRSYRFSVRARAMSPGVVLRLHNAAADDSLDVTLTPDWRQYSLDSEIHAVSTRAWLALGLASAGTAWIDDMELLDISPRITTVATPTGHTLNVTSIIDDVDVRLRLDGGQVTAADPLFTGPVTSAGSAQVRVGLFHGERLVSSAGLDLHHHNALSRFVDLEHPYSPRYAAGGPGALTDGILGTGLFTDGRWQGYEGQDLIAIIDLGEPVDVTSVSVRFLQSVGSWIWMPRVMEVNVSDDGRHFRPFATADHNVDDRESGLVIEELTARAASERARYVRVRARSLEKCPEWHAGAGGLAWVFADEIRVNPPTVQPEPQ
jgi:hypothetical protein